MVTLNLKLYAAPLALLMMAIPLASPKAYADGDPATALRKVEMRFTYDRSAPAREIYASLSGAVQRACTDPGPRPIALRRLDKKCAADLLAKAVEKIGRIDIAALHDHPTPRG
jgi:hypothetical protein